MSNRHWRGTGLVMVVMVVTTPTSMTISVIARVVIVVVFLKHVVVISSQVTKLSFDLSII
jgi:hypothetical protein